MKQKEVGILKLLEQWARKKLNLNKIFTIRYTTTWKCNSNCKSCDVWKFDCRKDPFLGKEKKELSIQELDKLTKNPFLKHVRRVVFSGGEPSLREDLPEIVQVFHKNLPKAVFGITLNGLNPEKTHNTFKRIKKLAPTAEFYNVGLSLNGMKEIHDKLRGKKGSFEKVIKTYKLIKNFFPTHFSFTLMKENMYDYYNVKEFVEKKLKSKVYLCVGVDSDRFGSNLKDLKLSKDKYLLKLFGDYIKSRKVNWFKRYDIMTAYFYHHLVHRKKIECFAIRQFFHLDPYGNVYPCNFIKFDKNSFMGNIRERDIKDIIQKTNKKLLKKVTCANCQWSEKGICGDSDLTCSINSSIPKVITWWILRKFKKK